MTQTEIKFATLEEMDYQRAYRAHYNTSFSPNIRAREEQEQYVRLVNGLYEEMGTLVTEDAQRPIFEAEMLRYKAGYLKHAQAYQDARSRCASTMIVGPANFPVRRQEKRNRIADKRCDEFLAWDKKARAAIRRNILNARSTEAKQSEDFELLKRDIASSMATAKAIDEGREPYRRSAFVNSAVGKIQRIANNGHINMAKDALRFIDETQKDWKKPFITKRHKIWDILNLEEETVKAAQPTGEDELLTFDGGKLVKNFDEDRLQILFDDIPSPEIRQELKSHGWRWSPRFKAWQRKLTNNAVYSAKQILAKEEASHANG